MAVANVTTKPVKFMSNNRIRTVVHLQKNVACKSHTTESN